jgi:small subunit ribosomal protein S19
MGSASMTKKSRARKGGGSAKGSRRKLRKRKSGITIRAKKEFSYRGYRLEELQEMSRDDIAELLPSRARRTLLRGFSEPQERLLDHLSRTDGRVRTHCRDMLVLPEIVGRTISVHNGKEYVDVTVAPEMIGHLLGEFAMTRKPPKHTGPGVGATRSSKHIPLK